MKLLKYVVILLVGVQLNYAKADGQRMKYLKQACTGKCGKIELSPDTRGRLLKAAVIHTSENRKKAQQAIQKDIHKMVENPNSKRGMETIVHGKQRGYLKDGEKFDE